jgi:hypothetical protein
MKKIIAVFVVLLAMLSFVSAVGEIVTKGGKLGVGTTNPFDKLTVSGAGFNGGKGTFESTNNGNSVLINGADVAGTNDVSFLVFGSGSSHDMFIGRTGQNAVAGDMRFVTNMAERIRIKSDGKVGIGTTNPGAKLTVSGSGFNGGAATFASTNSGNSILINGNPNGVNHVSYILFGAGSSFNTYIGRTGSLRAPAGDLEFARQGTVIMRMKSSGLDVYGTVGYQNLNQLSDARLKNVIGEYNPGLNAVMKLNPKTFEFKNSIGKTQVGFVAQDVQKVLPEAVSAGGEGYLSLDNTAIIASLVNGMQEQQKQIEQLKKEIAELKK